MHRKAFKPAPSANTLDGGDAARIISLRFAIAITLRPGKVGILEIVSNALRKANAFVGVGCPNCLAGRAIALGAHEKSPAGESGAGLIFVLLGRLEACPTRTLAEREAT